MQLRVWHVLVLVAVLVAVLSVAMQLAGVPQLLRVIVSMGIGWQTGRWLSARRRAP